MTTLIPNGKPLKTNGTCTHVLSTVTGHRPSSCRSKSVSCRHSMQSGERQTRSCNKTIVPSNACNVCCTRRTSTASDTQSIPPVAQSDQLPYYSGMNACIRTVQEAQPHACSNRLLFHYPRSNHSSRSVQQFSRNVLVQSVPNSSVGVEHAYRTVRSVPSDRMEFDLDGTVRHLTSAQRVKLMQDLSVVETNVNLLNDMLAELRPDTVGLDDLTLLQELHQTCQAMHLRVMEFLGQVSDEEATPTLLQVSDNLNSAFMRYERFERYRSRSTQSESVSSDSLDLSRSGGGPLPIMYSHEKPLLALTSKDSRESPRLPLALTSRSDQLDDDDDPLLDLTDASNRPSHSNLVSAEQVADWIAARQADESVRNVDHIARAMDRLALVPACVPPAHSSSCTSQKQYFRAVNSTDSVSTTGAAFTAPSATTSSTVSGGVRSKSSTSADLFQL
ncbi:unnamed protein product [Dicrocoelium dendriticum]|nr:unnamed protein product [Dicrocoelium dendriticum]